LGHEDGCALIKQWTDFFTGLYANPWVRTIALTLYYLAILLGLILMYGKGDFSTPSFVYQAF
jgi:hypothetical protein